MIDNETKFMTAIFVILLFFSPYKYAIYFLIFWIFVYMFGFFFTSIGLDLDIVKLETSEIYYQEYTGDYSQLYSKLSDYHSIRKKFNLPSDIYLPFGIFYDDPIEVQDVKQCRCIIGIIKQIQHGKEDTKTENNFEKELKIYLKNNSFKINTIPDTQCLNGNYNSLFSIQNSFICIAKIIIETTTMKYFRRLFVPKWKENKIKIARHNYRKHYGVMEIFRQNVIDLYIPVENEKYFFFHSVEAAPIRAKNKKNK